MVWNHFSLIEDCRCAVAHAVEALEPAGLADTPTEMWLQLLLAGTTLFTRGLVPAARHAMQRALAIAVATGDTEARLRSLRMIAWHENFSGQMSMALRAFETFLALAESEDPSVAPEGETQLGITETLVGRL